ncbi:MAG TPA: carboxypeptidase-like regulatory domain-containing protein, partial [Flavobacterium sp.]|nr:carboxypeptidase-like regulatory domain-containing protein [Flavobacterium sp.]
MRQTFINSLILLFLIQAGIAQNIKGKIVDSISGESIPYANIQVNQSESLISNAEGYFSLSENNSRDETMLTVSYLGFVNQQLTVAKLKSQQYVIKLEAGVFQLKDVLVSNEKPDPYQIMAKVKANLERNYRNDGTASKDMLFLRKSNYFKPKVLEVELDKSTGFTKQGLSKVNSDIKAFSRKLISQPPQEFTDILCNYYSVKTKKN